VKVQNNSTYTGENMKSIRFVMVVLAMIGSSAIADDVKGGGATGNGGQSNLIRAADPKTA
jgi:hypothetical protein